MKKTLLILSLIALLGWGIYYVIRYNSLTILIILICAIVGSLVLIRKNVKKSHSSTT